MDISLTPDTYTPSVDENGNYIVRVEQGGIKYMKHQVSFIVIQSQKFIINGFQI